MRYGAAGSRGTVHEPYAQHPKFPNPLIHVFYADGCSLAEAFYRGIWGPYQLMGVGDGLARPFARFVDVEVKAPPMPWKGTVALSTAPKYVPSGMPQSTSTSSPGSVHARSAVMPVELVQTPAVSSCSGSLPQASERRKCESTLPPAVASIFSV